MSLRVLVIEDQMVVALHIQQFLQRTGHLVTGIARNAEDAYRIAGEHPMDLVVSDINLEGEVDGISCYEMLYRDYKVPVVFVTAYRDIDLLKRVSHLNFIGYLVKPFREDELEVLLNLVQLDQNRPRKISEVYHYIPGNSMLYHNNQEVDLTKKEQMFVSLLVESMGTIVSYERMDDEVWGLDGVTDTARRQFVYRIRGKLPDFPLEFIKGVGYKLDILA